MDVLLVLAVSVLLQYAAAFLALRLAWTRGAGRAWALIAAVFLMGVRRSITRARLMTVGEPTELELPAELVALVISVLMVAGIGWIAPLFGSIRQSETALRESERKLAALMGNLPGMAYRCRNDKDWTMEFVSQGCLPLTGYRPSELLGNSRIAYGEVIHPDHREMIWNQVQEAVAQRRPFHLIYRIHTAAGNEKWVCEEGSSVCAENGELVAIEGFIYDVTERQQAEQVLRKAHEELEQRVEDRTAELTRANERLRHEIADRKQAEQALAESEQRFRALVETTSDWIWEMDHEGVYTYASPKVEELLGYPPDEVLGRKPLDLIAPEDTDQAEETLQEILAAGKPFVRVERTMLRKDRRPITLETSGVPIRDAAGVVRGFRGVDRDITKPKQDQARLIQTLAELERSNRDLAQFAYSASHDLQEPLRMTGSYLKALGEKLGQELDPQSQSYIELSLGSVARMQQLINSLLIYSRVGTSGKEFQEVDTGTVVDEAISTLQAAIEAAGAEVTRDGLPTVTADPTLLGQLFQNLIGNAVKFHDRRPPRVHVACQESNRQFVFSVRDNGIGIDPRYSDRIFTVFERLHPQDEYSGTGIGLAICKRVVERHGGKIWCESTEGEGTTFYFALPKHVETN